MKKKIRIIEIVTFKNKIASFNYPHQLFTVLLLLLLLLFIHM